MNILLRDLKRAGIMTADCTCFSDPNKRELVLQRKPGRTVMYMGDDVTPGPYWAVNDDDVPRLVAAGYEVNMVTPKQESGDENHGDSSPAE